MKSPWCVMIAEGSLRNVGGHCFRPGDYYPSQLDPLVYAGLATRVRWHQAIQLYVPWMGKPDMLMSEYKQQMLDATKDQRFNDRVKLAFEKHQEGFRFDDEVYLLFDGRYRKLT